MKKFVGGFVSGYEGTQLWVKDFKVGAKAAEIKVIEDSGYLISTGIVTEVVAMSSFSSEAEYFTACDTLCDAGDVTGEFIVDNDCYYVVINTDTYETVIDYDMSCNFVC